MLQAFAIVFSLSLGVVGGETKKHIVFVLAEDEYHAAEVVPKFAREELGDRYEMTFLTSDDKTSIPGLEKLREADLAIFYIRRRTLPDEQMNEIRGYLSKGKPLIALRTTSHAFENWPSFDQDVLGCKYNNHHGNKSGDNPTYVQVEESKSHELILKGLRRDEFTVPSWLYKSEITGPNVEVLLRGKLKGDKPADEPSAWTNIAFNGGNRVFYTMLGHHDDFAISEFRRLLVNAIHWALDEPVLTDVKSEKPGPLAGTTLLEETGDITSDLVAGIDRFCDRQITATLANRDKYWNRDYSSPEAYSKSIQPQRERLAKILGIVDKREPFTGFEKVDEGGSAVVADNDKFTTYRVRWPVVRGVHGEGLLLEPKVEKPTGLVVAIPSARISPEMIAGTNKVLPYHDQYAARCAEGGLRVVVPVIIDRGTTFSANRSTGEETGLTHREFVYRPTFELGRHLVGYEVQKVLAAIEGLRKSNNSDARKMGVIGLGVGGLIGACSAALDEQVEVLKCGLWETPGNQYDASPIDENLFGWATCFGRYELLSMTHPRKAIIDLSYYDQTIIKAGGRGAPTSYSRPGIDIEAKRFSDLRFKSRRNTNHLIISDLLALRLDHPVILFDLNEIERRDAQLKQPTVFQSLAANDFIEQLIDPLAIPQANGLFPERESLDPYTDTQPDARMKRQIDEILADTQYLLEESPYTREKFWVKAKPARDSRSVEAWTEATKWYRDYFKNEVIGHFDLPKLPPNPKSRQVFDEPGYTGYEVTLDVFPDVIAYGLLLVPKDIKEGERRPVVVCQHGLEGRPQDVASPKVNSPYYNQFGCRLAERGFVVFAPQNLYIFGDRFRVLQRKLNPMGKTLFSVIVPQHEQIVDWLATLPYVDDKRIGFYGLSYGGKSAMRIPALVEKYCLSICSADFNDWVWKNASTRSPYSYVWTGEYEIFEWNLGSTFNYAEMAGLICPRPFMVERGHHDGVAPDERVASEYAKVRRLYVDLKIPERTEIEFFDGPHTIHGVGTFEFLHKHLDWPAKTPPVALNK